MKCPVIKTDVKLKLWSMHNDYIFHIAFKLLQIYFNLNRTEFFIIKSNDNSKPKYPDAFCACLWCK